MKLVGFEKNIYNDDTGMNLVFPIEVITFISTFLNFGKTFENT